MKPVSVLFPIALTVFLAACNQASAQSAQGGNNAALAAKVDSLSTELNKIKQEFEILKYGLDKRGLSIEVMKVEMENDNKVWDIPDDDSPVFGNTKNPKVTIVEFTEFQCPYCSRIAPTIKDLMDKYPNDIKFVYKHFPLSFHANAKAAAAASIAAQKQGKFWEFRYALAPHSKELSEEMYLQVAKEIGLDLEKFKKDMVLDSAMEARIDKDYRLGVEVGVQGTPNFYVNGKRQDRFSPQMIEEMIKAK